MFRPGRDPLEVEIFRVVNVAEHPDLRAPALTGALHRLDDGEMVGVPFVYHDPDAFQFILVIPEGAEGRELSERAKLLDALMEEPSETVPSYVRHFTIAYGHDGLAEQVDEELVIEVDVGELEPVDEGGRADYFPRLAGLLPNAAFVEHLATDLTALVADDDLWLFATLDESSMPSFTEATSDLRLQVKTVAQVPVCILTLADESSGQTRRAYLNPDRAVDAPVLQMLARDFSATVILSDEAGTLVRSFRIEAPRAANARLVLERTEQAPSPSDGGWAAAVEAVRVLGPAPEERHPFEVRDEVGTVLDTRDRLRLLEAWCAPDRIEHAVLHLGVPQPVVELSRREILGDSVRYGLAMADGLVMDAVRFGFAPEAASLLSRMVAAFDQIAASASDHGLTEAEVAANRAALDRLAVLHGTSTEQDQSCTMEPSG